MRRTQIAPHLPVREYHAGRCFSLELCGGTERCRNDAVALVLRAAARHARPPLVAGTRSFLAGTVGLRGLMGGLSREPWRAMECTVLDPDSNCLPLVHCDD